MARKSNDPRAQRIKDLLARDALEDIPEDAPEKEGYAVMESPGLMKQEGRDALDTTKTDEGPILARKRASDVKGTEARMREPEPKFEYQDEPIEFGTGQAGAAAKAIAKERGETSFDLSKEQSWDGAGGYTYKYTPGEGGQAGSILVTHPDGQTATVDQSSKYWAPIMDEQANPASYDPAKYGQKAAPEPVDDGVIQPGEGEPDLRESPSAEYVPGEGEPDLGESPSAEYVPGQAFAESMQEYESQQPETDATAWPPGHEAQPDLGESPSAEYVGESPGAESAPAQEIYLNERYQPRKRAAGTGSGLYLNERYQPGYRRPEPAPRPTWQSQQPQPDLRESQPLPYVGESQQPPNLGESQQPGPNVGESPEYNLGESQPLPYVGESQQGPYVGESQQPPNLGESPTEFYKGLVKALVQELATSQQPEPSYPGAGVPPGDVGMRPIK